jgi:S-adenosylmethionine/arginine decarboxylase-like enzyme|tara:strand:+ start:4352 stop:4741 length:390 start_codon:yes stop_codon:yes gene_type:complete
MKEHKHLIVRAEVRRPPMNEEEAKKSIVELIDKIDMKLLMGPFAKYVEVAGNRGLTVASIIETSHVVLHSWDEETPAVVQLDVYTCSSLEPGDVFDWLQRYEPIKIQHKFIDREFDITIIDRSQKAITN